MRLSSLRVEVVNRLKAQLDCNGQIQPRAVQLHELARTQTPTSVECSLFVCPRFPPGLQAGHALDLTHSSVTYELMAAIHRQLLMAS